MERDFDLLVIGGGVNGAAIARDAAGRGLKVLLAEAGDLACGTSSASTKLVHGGLRYLEFGEFAMVRHALVERERMLAAAPHISRPLGFLLPLVPGGRSRWLLKAGLFLYDRLAPRHEVPGSSSLALKADAAGFAFRAGIDRAFRYWDGWIDDSRLVVLLARDAQRLGATILTRSPVTSARYGESGWQVMAGGCSFHARMIVNAAGPWAGRVAADLLRLADAPGLRLVQGAHLVTDRINPTDDAWMLPQPDGRIIFVLPYEGRWSLIGTTERDVASPDDCRPTEAEQAYLLEGVNRYLARPIGPSDIVRRFAGIRPLVLEGGKDARETTRDWRLVRHTQAPALTVVGGKITTCRQLAEAVVDSLAPERKGWTAKAILPGGDIPRRSGETARTAFQRWLSKLKAGHPAHDPALVERLAHRLGTDAEALLSHDLGKDLGGVHEAELAHMRDHEWARTAEDALWRRSKLGLSLDSQAKARVRDWFGA